jgi:cation transport protein ChaC
MLAGFYKPQWVTATLRDGRTVTAVTFEVDTDHCQYCGDLPVEKQAHHIAFAEGRRGACRDYLANTAAHARALGIHDPYIEDMVERVGHLRGEAVQPSEPPILESLAPGEA